MRYLSRRERDAVELYELEQREKARRRPLPPLVRCEFCSSTVQDGDERNQQWVICDPCFGREVRG